MQFATISIGSPEGVNKWVVQILFEKPTDSDYNDQSSRTAGTKASYCTVNLRNRELKQKINENTGVLQSYAVRFSYFYRLKNSYE